MKDRRDATLEKHCYLCKFVNLVVMKEFEFQQLFSQTKKYVSKIRCDKLLEKIRLGTYFGTVIFEVHVTENFKNKFAEMPPVFKNVEIAKQGVGPYIAAVCDKLNELKRPVFH